LTFLQTARRRHRLAGLGTGRRGEFLRPPRGLTNRRPDGSISR